MLRAEGATVETVGGREHAAAFLSSAHEGDFPLDFHLALKRKSKYIL